MYKTVDEQSLIHSYLAGENVRALAKKFELAVQTVYNILKRNDIEKKATKIIVKKEKLVKACLHGHVISTTAGQLGLSESTATRTLRKLRAEGQTVNVKKGRPSSSSFGAFSSGISPLLEHAELSLLSFPYPKITTEKLQQELYRLQNFSSFIKDKEIRPRSSVGTKICYPFFPNRYEARYKNNISAFDAWQNEEKLKKAINFQLAYGDPVTPERVLRALTLICRTPSIFRPATAKFIYEHYCPPGGLVWDPCSGYGGRLLGAFAAKVNYIGTDVEDLTIKGNKDLSAAIGYSAVLCLCPAEQFVPPEVDLVFTSPPYFNREQYSNNTQQSYKKHNSLDLWLKNFLRPVIKNSRNALRTKSYLILNIADIKENRKTFPLVEETIGTALSSGFHHVDTLFMPIGAINKKRPTEPILVFQKI